MKRWFIVVGVLLIAALAGLTWWLLAARPAPPAVTLLSEHTVLFMQAPHPAASRQRLRATAAYALWQEPEVRAFLEVPLHFLKAFASRGQARTSAIDIEPLLDRIEGEGFIAVTYLRTFPVFQPGLIAGADVGDNQLETRLALAGLARHLEQSQPAGQVDQRRYLGIRYTIWRPRPTWVVCFGSLNSLAVFTLGEDTMRDAIARFRGRSPPSMRSLADSPRFQRFQASIPADADLSAYLNLEPIAAMASPLLAMSPQTLGALQKLNSIDLAGLALEIQDQAVRETRLTLFRDPARQPAPPVARRTLPLTSPRTLFYRVGNTAWLAGYEEMAESITQWAALRRQLTGVPAEAAATPAPERFERSLAQRGTRLREDFLTRVGPETALLLHWREGAEFPDVALAMAVTNTPPPLSAVDNLLGVAKETWFPQVDLAAPETIRHGDHELHIVRIGAGLVAPTSFLADGLLVVASTPDFARELLDHLARRGPTLDTHPPYDDLLGRLPEDYCEATYCDLSGIYGSLRALLVERARDVVAPEFLDLSRLPAPATVRRHLAPFGSTTAERPGLRLTVTESPVGTPLGLVAATVTALGLTELLAASESPLALPGAPRASSGTAAPSGPRENRAAASPLPAPR